MAQVHIVVAASVANMLVVVVVLVMIVVILMAESIAPVMLTVAEAWWYGLKINGDGGDGGGGGGVSTGSGVLVVVQLTPNIVATLSLRLLRSRQIQHCYYVTTVLVANAISRCWSNIVTTLGK